MKFPRQRQEEVNVNITPLIDVVFLLLIFFMVSTTFTKETHLEVDLPEAENALPIAEQQEQESIEILITLKGDYLLNGKALINRQPKTLRKALYNLSHGNTEIPLTITADANTPYQAVVTAMDIAGKLGFEKLNISTQELQTQ